MSYCGCLVAKSCPCDPTDCSPPDSCVHTVSQARIPECVAMSFSKRSSQPRDRNHVSCLLHWQAGCLPLASPGSLLQRLQWLPKALKTKSQTLNVMSRVPRRVALLLNLLTSPLPTPAQAEPPSAPRRRPQALTSSSFCTYRFPFLEHSFPSSSPG